MATRSTCVPLCPLGPSTPGWSRNQKSLAPFPHPQVCCKRSESPPCEERVLPDSWAFPHCREMGPQGKSQVWPSQALCDLEGNAGLRPQPEGGGLRQGRGWSGTCLPPAQA